MCPHTCMYICILYGLVLFSRGRATRRAFSLLYVFVYGCVYFESDIHMYTGTPYIYVCKSTRKHMNVYIIVHTNITITYHMHMHTCVESTNVCVHNKYTHNCKSFYVILLLFDCFGPTPINSRCILATHTNSRLLASHENLLMNIFCTHSILIRNGFVLFSPQGESGWDWPESVCAYYVNT